MQLLTFTISGGSPLSLLPSRKDGADSTTSNWQKALKLQKEAEDFMVKGKLANASDRYYEACVLNRALDMKADTAKGHPLLVENHDNGFRRTGRMKLRHDAEQLKYLVSLGKLAQKPFLTVANAFKKAIEQLPSHLPFVDVGAGANIALDRFHNRAVHLTRPGRITGKVLSDLDFTDLERQFRESEVEPEATGCEAQNGVAFADGVLSDEVLHALYTWCLESTMWFSSRPGYVAAFMQEAFNAPLLVQVTEELRKALPNILASHELMNMWAFKYSNNSSDWPLQGTAVHADVAAVNLNLWLTPDEANEDPNGGGLIIYTKQAPKDWGFADYNSVKEVPRIKEFLRDSTQVVIPHRRNRMVLFNSNLFHETMTPQFRSGYANRRINLTLLFGRRCGGSGANEGSGSSRSSGSTPKVTGPKLSARVDRKNNEL